MMARVLVIDDQKVMRTMVAHTLGEAGYEVDTAEDGESGLERAREWCPDVIVQDIHMPGMDGFEVVERLKRDPETAPIPVIFLTGTAPTEDLVVQGLEIGAYDFLSKNDSDAELLARVGVMARIKRGHDELAAVAGASDTLIQTLDPTDLRRRFVEHAREVFRADGTLVWLEREAGEPERAATGIEPSDPLTDGLAEALLERLITDGLESAVLAAGEFSGSAGALLRREGFASVLAARVQREGGAPLLAAALASREDAFRGDGDGDLLHLLARQALVAIDNARLHARTQQQAEELEHALSVRSRFFASMSHELRTPINAIVGYNQLLEDGLYGELSEKQETAVDKVGRSAQHLLELVNDVLDISKIEAGKLEISPEPLDLAELVRDALTSVRYQAEQKGLELTCEGPDELPARTDPARVRQIVLNLLSNAVKFTEEGAVTVTVARRDAAGEETGARGEVRVRDTGPGISAEDQARIFEEFEQVAEAVKHGGTGLGLAISRRLAELLGGDLRLESEVGEGSTFTVELPLEPGPESSATTS